jgi:hypothetical protein
MRMSSKLVRICYEFKHAINKTQQDALLVEYETQAFALIKRFLSN